MLYQLWQWQMADPLIFSQSEWLLQYDVFRHSLISSSQLAPVHPGCPVHDVQPMMLSHSWCSQLQVLLQFRPHCPPGHSDVITTTTTTITTTTRYHAVLTLYLHCHPKTNELNKQHFSVWWLHRQIRILQQPVSAAWTISRPLSLCVCVVAWAAGGGTTQTAVAVTTYQLSQPL